MESIKRAKYDNRKGRVNSVYPERDKINQIIKEVQWLSEEYGGKDTKQQHNVKKASDLRRYQYLTTGCPILDKTLSGGFPTRSLIEVVGESNCGKTQLCLQLLLTAQWHPGHGGLGCRSLYIHTEGDSPMKRLKEFSDFHVSKGLVTTNACDLIYVEKCGASAMALYEVLLRVRGLLSRHKNTPTPLKLLVIDSIAHLFRDTGQDAELQDSASKGKLIYKIVRLLKEYADEYDLCVVATNHVVDAIAENQSHQAQVGANGRIMTSSGRSVLPALGLQWSQSINSRYFVSRTTQYLDDNKYNTSGVVRQLEVVFSSKQARKSSMYIINQFGLWGIPDSCLGDSVTKGVN